MNHSQLIEYFSKVMSAIFQKLGNARNLENDKASQQLITDVLILLDTLGIKSQEVMPSELEKAYRNAVSDAEKDLKAQNVKIKEIDPLDLLKKKIHLAAVKKLVNNTMTDIRKAVTRAKKDAKTKISRVVEKAREEMAKGLIKGTFNKVITKRLTKMFVEEGITGFRTTDKNGREINTRVEKYAATVVRTKMRDANTQGNVNRYKDANVGLVKISSHHPSCGKCAQYAGKVVSLTGEHKGFMSVRDIPLPPFHPNCRHTIAPYVIEHKTEEDIQKEKDQWKSFQPNREVRTVAQQKAYKREQDIRAAANREQQQYEKYVAVLGDKAPKTIGAFRRMKRAGGKSYKELQLAFRRGNAELKAGE
jgi:hypothetical protein